MSEREAVRRLVKSPPELWAQCSDPERLAKHLNGFGEITITELEPESTVAWEGESVSGTVTLEPSGWGTRVRLTAQPPAYATVETGPPVGDPASRLVATPSVPPLMHETAPPRGLGGLISAWLRRRGPARPPVGALPDRSDPADAHAATGAAKLNPPVEEAGPTDVVAELEAALDSLGKAHHRPYSRS